MTEAVRSCEEVFGTATPALQEVRKGMAKPADS
jgi:hypothetical protein